MRNELLAKSPTGSPLQYMSATLRRSESTTLQIFDKPFYDAESGEGSGGWRNALVKSNNSIHFQSPEQVAVFKALHAWRDHTARAEDESNRYVMPTHMLFNIAERMPKDTAGLFGCCTPVPSLVRAHGKNLVQLIEHARLEVCL